MRERSSRPNRKYAAIPNDAMRDKRLSAEARGLLALLMTYSDDWQFQREHLMEMIGMGKDRFGKVMGELIAHGYVELVATRDEKGRLLGKTWVIKDDATDVREMPTSDTTDVRENRRPEKPTSGRSAPLRIPTGKNTNLEEDLFGSIEPQRERACEEEKQRDRFDEFWAFYPKKVGKPAAIKAWQKAVKKHDQAKIIMATMAYAKSENVLRGFIKHPQGWLNEERFNDPDLQPPPPSSSKPLRYVQGGIVR